MDTIHVAPKELRTIVKSAVANAIQPFASILASAQGSSAITSPEDRMDIDQASAFVGFAKSYIYKLVSLREIPFSKQRKKLVFSRTALTQWLNSQTQIYSLAKEATTHAS